MKKLLFILAMFALVAGTATATAQTHKRSNGKRMVAKKAKGHDKAMWTQEDVERLDNGDVADLEMAFIQGLYYQYVFTGNIDNTGYDRYVTPKFTDEALAAFKTDEGYNWDLITGKTDVNDPGFTPADFKVKALGNQQYEVTGSGKTVYFQVQGSDGAYKIARVSAEPLQ